MASSNGLLVDRRDVLNRQRRAEVHDHRRVGEVYVAERLDTTKSLRHCVGVQVQGGGSSGTVELAVEIGAQCSEEIGALSVNLG